MKRGVVKGDIEAINASQLCEKERVRILDKKFAGMTMLLWGASRISSSITVRSALKIRPTEREM